MGTTFTFCNKVHCCHPQGWERVKNFDPSGVAFFPFLSSLSSQFSLASAYLSLPLCVVHHSNRENGITAMYKLVIALVRVVILVILTAMLVVKPTWEAHSQLPVEAEKRSPVRGNKQSYSSALLFTSFI